MKTITNYELRITNKKNSGQVAIIVLLISAIVMTIGLSVSKRTVVETKIDTSEEQLKQAFNTAESGIEYYLKTTKVGYTASDNSQAVIQHDPVGGGHTLDLGGLTLNNHTQFFWLTAHDGEGNIGGLSYSGSEINVCVGSGFAGAVKIDYFYKTGLDYYVWRSGYNVVNTTVNNYPIVSLDADGCLNVANILLAGNTPLLLTVRPMGMSTKLILRGNANFPSQGEDITSTGTVADSVSQVVRVFKQYTVPVFMIDGITADNVLSN